MLTNRFFKASGSHNRLLINILLCLACVLSLNSFCFSARNNPNDDNRILNPGKQYLYEEVYADSSGIIRKFFILLTVQPEPKFNQTLVRYTYFLSLDSLNKKIDYTWEETLATENKKSYEIHPPRANENEIHQLLPFPEIRLRKNINFKWKQTLTAFEGWNIPKKTKIISRYKIVGDSIIIYQGIKIACRKVTAVSQSKLGTGYSVFLFNKDYGFVLIENEINGITTRLELIDIR